MADLTFANDDLTLREMRAAYKKLIAEGKKPPFTATVTNKVLGEMLIGDWDWAGFVLAEGNESPDEAGTIGTMRIVDE